MKLFYSANSPYVRKIMILLHEIGRADDVELIADYKTSPMRAAEKLTHNPLNKVPVLITDDGFAIFDSSVIGQYLDTLHSGVRLYPEHGLARWQTLRNEAIGDGMADAAILVIYEERRRALKLFWQEWYDKQYPKLGACIRHLEEGTGLPIDFDAGAISLTCALGLIDRRLACWNWRTAHPKVADWYAAVCERPSVRATIPRD
jgi:glutathione S-transferase